MKRDDADPASADEIRGGGAKKAIAAAWTRLRGGTLLPRRAALSVAVGLAIGVLPLWGVHWALVLLVCVPLRLDAAVAYLAANVSIPPVAPFITMAELELGSRLLTGAWMHISAEGARALTPASVARELAVGAAALSLIAATVGGTITWLVARTVAALRSPNPE